LELDVVKPRAREAVDNASGKAKSHQNLVHRHSMATLRVVERNDCLGRTMIAEDRINSLQLLILRNFLGPW
jgi:hypothetical protein